MSMNLEKLTRDDMLRNLRRVRNSLDDLSNENFTLSCKEWVQHRRRTLSVLNELQKELDAVHIKISATRAVGAGVGVLGGVAALIGFGLRLAGNSDSKDLADGLIAYGGGAGALGGAAAGVACVAEGMLSQTIINEFKKALKEDVMYTEKLLPWFKKSQELEMIVDEVFGCSVLSDTVSDVFEIAEESKKIYERGGELLLQLVDDLSRNGENFLSLVLEGNRKCIERKLFKVNKKIQFIFQEFCNDPLIREAIWSICDLVRRSPATLEIAKIGIGVSLKMVSHKAVIFLAVPSAGQALFQAASKIANGLFLAISLAISVATLISAANDVKEGKSKYTKMLNDVKICLSTELKFLMEENPTLRLS